MQIALRLAMIAIALVSAALPSEEARSEYFVYIGTYTGPKSKGIYVSKFDANTGKIDTPHLAAEIERPSWLTIHPNQRFLYAVSEIGYGPGADGTMTGFALDPATGGLKKLNTVQTGGGGPCHLAINNSGTTLFVANYGSGSVASFRIQPDGNIGQRIAFVQHHGSSVNQKRQRGPHAHAVVLSADNRYLFVPDLGTDEIVVYAVSADGNLSRVHSAKLKPGSGPRHFVFHPAGRFAYALNEMGSRVAAFAYDPSKGDLREIQAISTLPADFSGENNSAEIEVDARADFLYATNRGHNSIAVFALDGKKGTLTEVQRVPTQGKTPRNIRIDPTGRFLLAANQDSDNVVVFRRDATTG